MVVRMIFFSLKGRKFSGRVCKSWCEANIYLNVLYRIFRRWWEKGYYDDELVFLADFLREFWHVFHHEALHVLVKKLHGTYHSSEKRIEFLANAILDRFFDCFRNPHDEDFWKFWLTLSSEIFKIPVIEG